MIDPKVVEQLVRLLDESSLDSLEIERAGTRIRLAKSPSAVPAAPPAAAGSPGSAPGSHAGPPADAAASESAGPAVEAEDPRSSANLVDVTSPMVGTFYRAPSPEADPYVADGDAVAQGDVLCVIEAMKLMNELECETAGRVAEICVRNAEPVEFGQVLFRIDPA